MWVLEVPLRPAAAALAVSGLVVAAGTPWHPDIFEQPLAEVVRGDRDWSLWHGAWIGVVMLALVGAAGLVAGHRGGLGHLGQVGLAVEIVGVVAAGALAAVEALVFPMLAERAPDLLSLDQPWLTSPPVLALGVLAAGWPLGLSLLGIAAARARVFPPQAGLVLAVGGPLFLALEGPFVPVAGVLSGVLFGGAQVWWGALLWRAALSPSPPPQ